MNKTRATIIALVFLLPVLWPACTFSQTNLYVSLKGNDAGSGTRNHPFATIHKAVEAARKTAGPVVIKLFGGTYHIMRPIVFTPDDARKSNGPLTITSVENQQVVIGGGTPIRDLNWKKYKNGIWQTTIHQDLIFDELFVNGQLQRMARYPNFDSTARFLGGTAADVISNERASRWRSPTGGYVHALHRSEWGDFHYRITGKSARNELALEGGWQNNRRMGMHDKHRFVENIFEELDAVNEWFYDQKTKTLYYYLPDNIDLKKSG